jgi:hypothetical protein
MASAGLTPGGRTAAANTSGSVDHGTTGGRLAAGGLDADPDCGRVGGDHVVLVQEPQQATVASSEAEWRCSAVRVVDACQCGGCGACHADVTSSDGFMPMSRSGHRTTLRRGFPCNHSDITSTVGRPMAPRRRGWWARRLSGRGIGRVLSSPPSDGWHGVTEWPPTSALSVRIASANTWADMVGAGPEPALQRWSVRRVKAHTSAAGFRCTRILAGTDDPGTEGHGNCRRSGTLRDSDVLIARVPGKRQRWRSMYLPIRRKGGNQTQGRPRTPYVREGQRPGW